MYGKQVTIKNEEQEVTVFVFCTPDTSRERLVKRAKEIIMAMD